jgi:signal transduction histidine kinase
MSNSPPMDLALAHADLALVQDERHAHVVQFYDSDAHLGEAATRFLAPGLGAGEAVIVVGTPVHASLIVKGLEAHGLDAAGARAAGLLVVLDAEETIARFTVRDVPRWDLFEREVGGAVARAIGQSRAGRARAYGEMVDLLWRRGRQEVAIELEGFWNRLGEKYSFSLLCAYVMGNFFKESHSADFLHVCNLHDKVQPAGGPFAAAEPSRWSREVSLLQQRALALETELLHRKELEEALRCAREQAEAASRAKDDFLAMLGHELRNPLSPILTALELMKLRGDGRPTREQEVIERQTRHLTRLVDDLLDVSRVSRGVLELRKQRIDLRDVLAKAAEMASPLLEIRRHRLELHAPPRGVLIVDGDETRLSQVVANLMTNAAKYTPPGGNVSVTARREGPELLVEVRDDGIGIAPDLLPRIFDLFVQGRQPVDRADGGLGIGLALVRSLVQLHEGSVQAQSDGPGKGSVFTVRLPAADRTVVRSTSVEAASRDAATAPRRILLVDDNEDSVAMMAELLRAAGHEVRTAVDGNSALEVARSFRPHLAILDIGLPAMDGYQLAARLRTQCEDPLTLYALSGYGQESDRARSQAAGFARHLVKPLEIAELLSAIEKT